MEFIIENKGKIFLPDDYFWNEWYLVPEDDFIHEHRTYLNKEWFKEQLEGNEEALCKIASQIEGAYADYNEGKALIQECNDKIDEFIGDAGFDTCVYALEMTFQEALKRNDLHWW